MKVRELILMLQKFDQLMLVVTVDEQSGYVYDCRKPQIINVSDDFVICNCDDLLCLNKMLSIGTNK